MANINEYLDWRGDVPFSLDPFNDVDNLILSELAYTDFEGIVPPPGSGESISLREAYAAFYQRHTREEIEAETTFYHMAPFVMDHLIASRRFQNLRLANYVNVIDEAKDAQFSAITFLLGREVPIALDCAGDAAHARIQLPADERETVYVAYRGTDDSIVGWKEDLNMGYLEVIPSQTRALEYLGRMTRQYPDAKLRIGGHSKGGNLSVYAAVKAPAAVQDRIVRVYNNDGPGFAKPLVGTPEHTRVADRILTVVPQSSVVGQLLEHEQNVEIVRSDAEGMLQHDGFSWQVVGDHFIHLDDFSREGKVIDETLESWEGSLSPKQREAFADALYTVLTASGAKTLSDLNGDKLKSAVTMLKTYSNLDRETRQLLSGSLRALVGSYAKNVADDVQKNDLEPLRRKLERQRKKAEKRGAKKK